MFYILLNWSILICFEGVGLVNPTELVQYCLQSDNDWPFGHCPLSTGELAILIINILQWCP